MQFKHLLAHPDDYIGITGANIANGKVKPALHTDFQQTQQTIHREETDHRNKESENYTTNNSWGNVSNQWNFHTHKPFDVSVDRMGWCFTRTDANYGVIWGIGWFWKFALFGHFLCIEHREGGVVHAEFCGGSYYYFFLKIAWCIFRTSSYTHGLNSSVFLLVYRSMYVFTFQNLRLI